MQRRSRGNGTGDDSDKRHSEQMDNANHALKGSKRRRVADNAVPAPSSEEPAGDNGAQSTATSSISILLDAASSPASVLKAILDIKDLSNVSPSTRSLVVDTGCIPPLLQRLGSGFEANDEHILQVISVLCKENQIVRKEFRTITFIKKAVALAIPALGDLGSLNVSAKLARSILKALSGSSDYDKEVLSEQQQRLDSLTESFLMAQTSSCNSKELCPKENCDSCSVCLESLDLESTVVPTDISIARLPCNHFFHKSCISKWFSKHTSCPVCRYKLQEPPKTPPILSPAFNFGIPLSFLLGLSAFGGPGLSFALPASPSPGGINFLFLSFRSGNAQPRGVSPEDFVD